MTYGRGAVTSQRPGAAATDDAKTRLRRELQQLEHRLYELRSASEGDADGKELKAAELVEAAQAVELHEVTSLSTERLVERGRRLRRALTRIASGGYGICEECGARIALRRLSALPDAVTCVACQEQLERREAIQMRGARSILPDPE